MHSLLDILKSTVVQQRAADRQTGVSRRFHYSRDLGNQDRKRELARLRKARYRSKYKDSNIEKLRVWVLKNPEKALLARKRWDENNRDRSNATARRYRQRKKCLIS